MNQGNLITVNGGIYEYIGIDEAINLHKVAEVEIDAEGKLTATHSIRYFSAEELKKTSTHFTMLQWYGIVEHFIRQDYDLTDEEIAEAAEDIISRCFAYEIPKLHELADYIAEYMNR